MSGRPKNLERLYYEELFEALDIPFIRRTTPNSMGRQVGVAYFINPVTGRSNDVSLVNIRRAVEQMVEADIMDEGILYEPDNSNNDTDTTDETTDDEDYDENINEEKIESKTTYDNPTYSTVYNVLKSYRGQSPVRIVIYKDGDIVIDRTYRVPEVGFAGFWDDISSYELMENSETLRIPVNEYTGDFSNHNYSMEVFKVSDIVGGQPVIQHFNDGIKHCILYPIQEWAKGCYEKSVSKSAKSRYNTKLKKIKKLMVKYKEGVPETELQAICELLQVDIKVDLPLDINEPFIYCKSTRKRLRLFEFINTRLDHVDLNEVVLNENINKVTRDEIYELKDALDEKKEYYIYQKDLLGLSSITTFKGKYAINNEYLTTKNEFEEKTNLTHYKIDDVLDNDLSAFVKRGTHYNLTVDFKDTYPFIHKRKKEVKHIDQSKAYSNFHKCKWYEGFMGNITDFRKTDKIVTNGMYLVEAFDFKNADTNLRKYNDIMRIYCNNNIYGSPELKMLSSMGVTYTIKAGCWGVKSIDFRFNDDMLEKKDSDNNRYYAKWTGGCDQHNLEQSFYMKGDRDLFQNISNYVSQGIVKWVGVNEGCISYKKDRNYHLGHITAQITMYMRMNMMEQLLVMNINNIIRVCVDGVYYTGDTDFKICNVFRTKTEVNFGNEAGDKYASNIYIETDDESIYDLISNEFADEREHFRRELHLGAGGTGKTHKALTDKGLIRVLYVAPSRKLVRKKNADYAITSDVLANLIINDPEKYEKIARYFNVLVLDEVSMYSEKNKKAIFERFENHKLIFCGDVGYQLPTWGDEPITTDGFDKVFNHTVNYRIKCNELKKLCDLVRLLIREGIKKDCIEKRSYRNRINRKVENFFKKRGRMIDHDELKEKYDIKDYILVGTKEVGWEYTGMFKGKFDEEKYYIQANTSEHSNGDIVFSKVKPSGCNAEIRHHFTTHSIQGETIESKIFIDCSKMFDSRMFYTAISRARQLDQIYIVKQVKL